MRIAFVGDSLTAGRPGSSYLAVLRERLPGHTLVNLGRGNDTVISLYRRIARRRFDRPFDLCFLWVGVNDVSERGSWSFRVVNALSGQPRSTSLDQFRGYYRAALDLLGRHAARVVAVSPALKGEDPGSELNRRLEGLSGIIEELAGRKEQVEYLDLRARFLHRLAGRDTSGYLPQSAFRVALDALTLRSDEQVDRRAARRGLYLTLDGIHLNSTGAEIVAEAFLETISGRCCREKGRP